MRFDRRFMNVGRKGQLVEAAAGCPCKEPGMAEKRALPLPLVLHGVQTFHRKVLESEPVLLGDTTAAVVRLVERMIHGQGQESSQAGGQAHQEEALLTIL